MDTRQKMIEFRKNSRINIRQMARICQCSHPLLRAVEAGWITHPNIAARIARAYMLDVDAYNDLVSAQHRAKKIPKLKPSQMRP